MMYFPLDFFLLLFQAMTPGLMEQYTDSIINKKKIIMKKRNTNQVVLFFFLIVLLTLSAGCSRTRGIIQFQNLKHPVSTSAFLFDQNFDVVMKGKELEVIHTFEFKKTFWSVFYGSISLTSDEILGLTINEIVDQYNGDGVINLKLTQQEGLVNKFYSFMLYLPSSVPILPSTADIWVSGEVVKLKEPDE